MAQRRVAWSRAAAASVAAGCCALGIGAAIYGYGCSVYSDALLLPGASDGATQDVLVVDSGTDAHDSGAPETGPGPCADIVPPQRPAMDDPSDAGDQSFVVAVHTVNMGLGDAGVAGLGYDLDSIYTHPKAPACGPESCKAALVGQTHPDGPGGVDDSAGQLIVSLAGFDPQFNTTTINQRLQSGQYSILLQVLHYNGTQNDTQVSVGMYAALGIENDAGALWNGQDSWSIDSDFVANGDAQPPVPNHLDGNAYVAGGVLFMKINFPITIGSGGTAVTIQLTAGLATAKIVATGNQTYRATEGQIAGRWNVSDLLGAIQNVYVGTTPLCRGTTFYGLIKNQACQYADIMTDPTLDLMPPATMPTNTCDALSLGIGFTADPALMGGIVPPSMKLSPCPDAGGPPDNCGP